MKLSILAVGVVVPVAATILVGLGLIVWAGQADQRAQYTKLELRSTARLPHATLGNGQFSIYSSYFSRDQLGEVLSRYLRYFRAESMPRTDVTGDCLTLTKLTDQSVIHQRVSIRLCPASPGKGTWVEIGRSVGLTR